VTYFFKCATCDGSSQVCGHLYEKGLELAANEVRLKNEIENLIDEKGAAAQIYLDDREEKDRRIEELERALSAARGQVSFNETRALEFERQLNEQRAAYLDAAEAREQLRRERNDIEEQLAQAEENLEAYDWNAGKTQLRELLRKARPHVLMSLSVTSGREFQDTAKALVAEIDEVLLMPAPTSIPGPGTPRQ
jgi:chromosome segregation ATPase